MVEAQQLSEVMAPLFEALPLSVAMPSLLPKSRRSPEIIEIASALEPKLPSPALQAGLWLFVDDLERSHGISQGIHSSLGSMWHAIMHRREGDFSNSKYWLRQAGPFQLDLEGFDPAAFVDAVSRVSGDPADLVQIQRQEWLALFNRSAMDAGQGGVSG